MSGDLSGGLVPHVTWPRGWIDGWWSVHVVQTPPPIDIEAFMAGDSCTVTSDGEAWIAAGWACRNLCRELLALLTPIPWGQVAQATGVLPGTVSKGGDRHHFLRKQVTKSMLVSTMSRNSQPTERSKLTI